MKTLHQDWIIENHIDLEYKKYVLLAYLNDVKDNFSEQRLYPFLSDLITHYNNLVALKKSQENIYNRFPERMTGVDIERLYLEYEKVLSDDKLMEEIVSIIDFSIPLFENYLGKGKKIYEEIDSQLYITPVGITPLKTDEGYLLLCSGKKRTTQVYGYQITIFDRPDARYRGIRTQYIDTYEKSLSNTFENIKSHLIIRYSELPNPATYCVETSLSVPEEATLLPMAKRTLIRYVCRNEIN
jgi:hypothetical protein